MNTVEGRIAHWRTQMYNPLDLSHLGLTELPEIPEGVHSLDISYNQFVTLGTLPASLQYLNCVNNYITELDNLPPYIDTLYCSYNPLQKIHALPPYLQTLACGNTLLEELPLLPEGILTVMLNSCKLFVLSRPFPRSVSVVALYDTVYAKKETETMGQYVERLNLWASHTQRLQSYRKELVMTALAPHRVERWIAQGGFELFDQMMGLT